MTSALPSANQLSPGCLQSAARGLWPTLSCGRGQGGMLEEKTSKAQAWAAWLRGWC